MKLCVATFVLLMVCCPLSITRGQDADAKGGDEARRPRPAAASERMRRQLPDSSEAAKDPAEFRSDAKDVFSGPQRDEKLPVFEVTSLIGDDKGKRIDLAKMAGKRPQILVFQDDNGVALRGLYGTMKAINAIDEKSKANVFVAPVFLSDDMDAIANRYSSALPKLRERGIDAIAVSHDGRDGPGSLGLNRTVAQTIVLVKDGKVVRNFVFRQGMLYSDAYVMGGIAELIGKDIKTVSGWVAEAHKDNPRMRRQMQAERK